jgi:hypothetical protein
MVMMMLAVRKNVLVEQGEIEAHSRQSHDHQQHYPSPRYRDTCQKATSETTFHPSST